MEFGTEFEGTVLLNMPKEVFARCLCLVEESVNKILLLDFVGFASIKNARNWVLDYQKKRHPTTVGCPVELLLPLRLGRVV